jgi:glucan endo-1,3-alpha-glucosidase
VLIPTVVTWNDYGESHHIGPYTSAHSDDGSSRWTAGMDHTAMLDMAVPYIAAFKAGLKEPVITQDMVVYWYRPHLKSASCDGTDNCGSKPTGWEVSPGRSNLADKS